MLDVLIEGGEVIDGSGAPRQRADVAIEGGRIAAIGALQGRAARRRIDAEGQIVAPGFIDCHTHDDALLLEHPLPHPKLAQGVTTVIAGNCGVSLAPLVTDDPPPPLDLMGRERFRHARFADYLAALRAAQPVLNAAALVGHTTLRIGHVADLSRAATAAETARMQAALAEALDAGAIGLSTGVYYPPARAATTEELIAVAEPLRDGRGLITMHIRDEADAIDDALREALAVGRAVNAPLVLSHHKLMGRSNHGRSVETLALIEAAARQQSVCFDCYPYVASSTMLLPARVAQSADVRITWSRAEPAAAGRSLLAMAAERGVDPVALAERLQPAGAIYFAMSDEDVDRILAHPLAMIGSDGLPHDAVPHPRLWGSFPRVLGHYVRERRVLALEAAVHKMTGLTARRFGLAARGELRPGWAADVTVFDAARVIDGASFDEPTTLPQGIRQVLVNGQLALDGGRWTDARAGQVLRRTAA
ncbi:MAG: D-aminoacylase [Proteobacteria bacterium]|nr:D-aminoacylase [Pseudomonadota bacterium]